MRMCEHKKVARYNVMSVLRGCHAVKFDTCNNLLTSVRTILVIILQYIISDRVLKTKNIITNRQLHVPVYRIYSCLPNPIVLSILNTVENSYNVFLNSKH